jgi:hypothetical protein
MKDNHPNSAIKISFKPLNGKKVRYWIWEKGGKYYWSCLGQSGQEVDQEGAMRAAREWALFGINGLASHGQYRGVGNESGSQSN